MADVGPLSRVLIVWFFLTTFCHAVPELTLSDAVSSTLANADQLKASWQKCEAAKARVEQARWKKAGSLETLLLYTPIQKPMTLDVPSLFPGMTPLRLEFSQLRTYALSGTYTLPLWTWGALEGNHQASALDAKAALCSHTRAREEMVFQASQTFLHAAAAVAGVDLAEEALAQQNAFLAVASSRVRAGVAAKLDQLKAELAVSRAQSALLEAQNRAALAREALAALTQDDRFRTALLALPQESEERPPDEKSALDKAVVEIALAQRRDLESAKYQVRALESGGKATRASSLPSVALRASITQQSQKAAQVFAADSRIYSLGFAFTWDGLESMRARARAAELEAQAKAATHGRKALEESISLEVRGALHRLREARLRNAVQERAVRVAQEQARVARLAYQEGALTALEAQDAELALSAARFDALRARTDAAISMASLRLAVGD